MKNFNFKAVAAFCAALALVSCGKTASVKGTVADAPESEVIVKLLDVNRYEVLDTVATGKDGSFSYKVEMKKNEPEFIYLFYKETKIASLLLQAGDRVNVSADTLGAFSVSGSAETEKLMQVEKELADFSARFLALSDRLDKADPASAEAKAITQEMGKEYIGYYRSRVKYVMENSHSLTVVPVMFQMISPNLPVFSQETDAIHFKNMTDSLSAVYPDSRYVKALKKEADRRQGILELGIRLQNAEQLDFPEVEMPDVNGVKRKLSEVDRKVVLLHFWSAADPAQKMFNLDVLAPVYNDFKSKGFEIYQVAIDVDKASWARTVKEQNLGWINVCDGLGTASPAVGAYNVNRLPVSYLLADGQLVGERISDEASLRKVLNKLL